MGTSLDIRVVDDKILLEIYDRHTTLELLWTVIRAQWILDNNSWKMIDGQEQTADGTEFEGFKFSSDLRVDLHDYNEDFLEVLQECVDEIKAAAGEPKVIKHSEGMISIRVDGTEDLSDVSIEGTELAQLLAKKSTCTLESALKSLERVAFHNQAGTLTQSECVILHDYIRSLRDAK